MSIDIVILDFSNRNLSRIFSNLLILLPKLHNLGELNMNYCGNSPDMILKTVESLKGSKKLWTLRLVENYTTLDWNFISLKVLKIKLSRALMHNLSIVTLDLQKGR